MQTLHVSNSKPITIPATQFVRQCRQVLDSLQRGGEVIITRHQQQIAKLTAVEPLAAGGPKKYTLRDVLDEHYGRASPLDTDWQELTHSLRDDHEPYVDPWERKTRN